MPKRSGVTVRDRGWNKILRTAQTVAARKPAVHVGIVGAQAGQAHGDDGITNAELGAIHEYGAGRIPQRSFIGDTVDAQQRVYQRELAAIGQAVAAGSYGAVAGQLNRLGLRAVGDIQKRIAEGIPPALSEETIARKGSSTPLIDSGQLRKSLSHEVRT